MINFNKLNLLEVSPEIAFLNEDGLPNFPEFDLNKYDGPLTAAAALSYSARADEIRELSEISQRLDRGDLVVIRVSVSGSKFDNFTGEDYPCLQERGIDVVVICENDLRFSAGSAGIQQRFVWAVITIKDGTFARWKQLVYFKAFTFLIEEEFQMPHQLSEDFSKDFSEDFGRKNEPGFWWEFPISVSTQQIIEFADYLALFYFDNEEFDEIVQEADDWTVNYLKSGGDFELMFRDFQLAFPWFI